MFPFCFVLRTMITRSAFVLLHSFTSAERVLNVGWLLQVFISMLDKVTMVAYKRQLADADVVIHAALKEGALTVSEGDFMNLNAWFFHHSIKKLVKIICNTK